MFKITKLRELKSRLYNEKNLSKVWSFYMDNFTDHKEFTDLGQPVHHSFLEEVVPLLSKQIMGENPQDLFLIIIPEYQFIHGSFMVKNSIGGVMYFEESLKGMVAISEFPPSNMVKYSRFTGEPINNGNPMN
jgi:hypothetical protein